MSNVVLFAVLRQCPALVGRSHQTFSWSNVFPWPIPNVLHIQKIALDNVGDRFLHCYARQRLHFCADQQTVSCRRGAKNKQIQDTRVQYLARVPLVFALCDRHFTSARTWPFEKCYEVFHFKGHDCLIGHIFQHSEKIQVVSPLQIRTTRFCWLGQFLVCRVFVGCDQVTTFVPRRYNWEGGLGLELELTLITLVLILLLRYTF